MCYLVKSDSLDPYLNLAVESYLMKMSEAATLFLWQNANTVVIGKHQNPYTECSLVNMEKDSVRLARRETGGGAVYHDEGNVNYSFVVPSSLYNVERQFGVVVSALADLGVEAVMSGRNDLMAMGVKVSGNAFLKRQKNCLHHGTILLDTDIERMSLYLTPSYRKLKRNGVKSVKARVGNLSTMSRTIDRSSFEMAIVKAFEVEYGKTIALDFGELAALEEVEELRKKYSENQYLFGRWSDII